MKINKSNLLFIVTGANGHLGSTIIRILEKQKYNARGLIIPSESAKDSKFTKYYRGDITGIDSLKEIFDDLENKEVYVIHTAGIVDISDDITEQMKNVNINGTKNIIKICSSNPVKRLVYISSVHAIAEKNDLSIIKEANNFSADNVTGGYAKTKAIATQAVLEATKNGLNAVIVHPSGILGPFDNSGNHIVQMVSDYIKGTLPAGVKGGYDFVDVRDVAIGCINAALYGKNGDCYILSNRHYDIKDILHIIKDLNGGKKIPFLPVWLAKAVLPFINIYAKIKHIRPLYTNYSLYTLNSNDRFSHDKATKELKFYPRDLRDTLKDTISWLKNKKAPVQ